MKQIDSSHFFILFLFIFYCSSIVTGQSKLDSALSNTHLPQPDHSKKTKTSSKRIKKTKKNHLTSHCTFLNTPTPTLLIPTLPDQTLQESLHDDQQALRRMIMILSLVGGFGFLALITTMAIVVRMRQPTQPLPSEPVFLRQSLEPSAPPVDESRDLPPAYTVVPSAPPHYVLPQPL